MPTEDFDDFDDVSDEEFVEAVKGKRIVDARIPEFSEGRDHYDLRLILDDGTEWSLASCSCCDGISCARRPVVEA